MHFNVHLVDVCGKPPRPTTRIRAHSFSAKCLAMASSEDTARVCATTTQFGADPSQQEQTSKTCGQPSSLGSRPSEPSIDFKMMPSMFLPTMEYCKEMERKKSSNERLESRKGCSSQKFYRLLAEPDFS